MGSDKPTSKTTEKKQKKRKRAAARTQTVFFFVISNLFFCPLWSDKNLNTICESKLSPTRITHVQLP